MSGKVLNSVVNLANLPHPLKQPIVVQEWNWHGLEFTIVSVEGRRKMTAYSLPVSWEWDDLGPAEQAIKAWCDTDNNLHVLDYLDRMFGDRYPKRKR